MNPVFFLTRLENTDDALAAQASSLGFTVLRVPLLATEPGPDSHAILRSLEEVRAGSGIAWTSRRGAEALARSLHRNRAALNGIPLYALGEESAAPIRRMGYDPMTPEEDDGAPALARLILERAGTDHVERILYLRGDRSLPELPKALETGGIQVMPLEVYRTSFRNADLEDLAEWLRLRVPVAIAFFSPTGVMAVERLLDAEARELVHEHAIAIARGQTTGRALDEAGYRNVFRPKDGARYDTVAKDALVATLGVNP